MAMGVYISLSFITPNTSRVLLVIVFLFLGLGLGSVIAPMTTRITLATPPLRSGAGSAAQNTVRQVGAVLGVAVLSSAVATVYSNKMTTLLAGKVPAPYFKAATGSIGGTKEVISRGLAAGRISQAQYDAVWNLAVKTYMSSFHVATAMAAVLVLIALVILLIWLPAKAEAVAWAAAAPTGADLTELESDAASQIHQVDDKALAHGTADRAPESDAKAQS
jgi:MFS transporter, DHA2 family, multidrug resistance protein